MSLDEWVVNRWVTPHAASRDEIAELLVVVDRDLADAAVAGLSADWRLGIAYNAILQLATLALAAEGFRPGRERAHERAIQSLTLTLGLDASLVDAIDGIRRKRNISNYERAGTASEAEAAEVFEIAMELRSRALKWLRQEHRDLVSRS